MGAIYAWAAAISSHATAPREEAGSVWFFLAVALFRRDVYEHLSGRLWRIDDPDRQRLLPGHEKKQKAADGQHGCQHDAQAVEDPANELSHRPCAFPSWIRQNRRYAGGPCNAFVSYRVAGQSPERAVQSTTRLASHKKAGCAVS